MRGVGDVAGRANGDAAGRREDHLLRLQRTD
jgi:hypothetical protein